jgi:hypothetical protein
MSDPCGSSCRPRTPLGEPKSAQDHPASKLGLVSPFTRFGVLPEPKLLQGRPETFATRRPRVVPVRLFVQAEAFPIRPARRGPKAAPRRFAFLSSREARPVSRAAPRSVPTDAFAKGASPQRPHGGGFVSRPRRPPAWSSSFAREDGWPGQRRRPFRSRGSGGPPPHPEAVTSARVAQRDSCCG